MISADCPGAEVSCECPFYATECEGAWTCDDVEMITNDFMTYYDTNDNGVIEYGDNWSQEDIDAINSYCDHNDDGVTDACEIHNCILDYENDWRLENCPEYPDLYCECPY